MRGGGKRIRKRKQMGRFSAYSEQDVRVLGRGGKKKEF